MTRNTKLTFVAAAMGGLLAGATSRLSAAGVAPAPSSGASHVLSSRSSQAAPATAFSAGTRVADADQGKHDCKGKNDCKGKGGCKTGDNGCKGKNSCKAKGGCSTK